ncbi:hypothetical protein WA158_000850 [Blastocystis sp. Blastoise]
MTRQNTSLYTPPTNHSVFGTFSKIVIHYMCIGTFVSKFFFGGMSGAVSKTVCAPFSRLTVLLETSVTLPSSCYSSQMVSKQSKIVGTMKNIYTKEGLKGFFRGNLVDIMKGFPYSAVSYCSYEFFSYAIDPHLHGKYRKMKSRFLSGAFAGMCSVSVTYPIDLFRTQLYVSKTGKISEVYYNSMNAFRKYGISAFYRGLFVCILAIMPNMAINFTSYEYYREFLSKHTNIPVWLHGILCGMCSSVTANTITYPLHMIQRNLQVDGLYNNNRQYHNIKLCIEHIYKSNGIKGFYYGLLPQYLKAIPKSACSFAIYEKLKEIFKM